MEVPHPDSATDHILHRLAATAITPQPPQPPHVFGTLPLDAPPALADEEFYCLPGIGRGFAEEFGVEPVVTRAAETASIWRDFLLRGSAQGIIAACAPWRGTANLLLGRLSY